MISSLCGGEFASKKSASVKRFLPRFLGVWLTINGFAYVTISFTGVLLPQYQDKVFSMSFPALLGELAIMLWLVVKGAKPQPLDAAALSSSAA